MNNRDAHARTLLNRMQTACTLLGASGVASRHVAKVHVIDAHLCQRKFSVLAALPHLDLCTSSSGIRGLGLPRDRRLCVISGPNRTLHLLAAQSAFSSLLA